MLSRRSRFQVLSGAHAAAAAGAHARNAFQDASWVDAVAAVRGRPHAFVAVQVAEGAHAGACLFGGVHRRFGIEVFESMPMAGYGGWSFAEEPADEDAELALTQRWLAESPWWLASLTGVPGREHTLPSLRLPSLVPASLRRRLGLQLLRTHIASLAGDDETLLRRARPKARNQLRRVDRAGYAFEINGPGAVDEFCHLYRAGSAEWKTGASRLLPDAFFSRLHGGGRVDIWRVRRAQRCTAAAFFLKGHREVFYQASGTLREPAEVSAIDALLWTAMRHYRDSGFSTLNMGASEGLDSVRFFKEKLGAAPVSYWRTTVVLPHLVVARHRPLAS